MNLKSKVIKGIFWLIVSNTIVQIIKFITKIALARLLFPSDFGIIAVAWVVIAALSLFKTFGIDTALIHRKAESKESFNTTLYLTIIFGIFLTSAAYLISPFIAAFFRNPLINPILKLLSFTFFISSFSILPQTIIDKQLLFKKRLIPEIASIIAFGFISVTLAFLGFGVWSIAIAQLASTFTNSILYWIVLPFKPIFKFSLTAAKELLSYGKHIFLAGALLFLIKNLDNILIGKILGVASLGFYALAYTIANLVATEITHIINKVVFPAYSLIQDNKENLKNAYLKILKFTSLISVPLAFIIFLFASEITIVLFGQKWTPMIPSLIALSFYGMIRSIAATTGPFFQATGKPNILKQLAFLQLIIITLIIYPLTIKYNILGTSIAMLISIFLVQFLAFYKLSKITGINYCTLWKIIFFPFIISTVVSLLIFLIKNLLAVSFFTLLILIALWLSFYLLLIFLLKREVFREIKELIKISTGLTSNFRP